MFFFNVLFAGVMMPQQPVGGFQKEFAQTFETTEQKVGGIQTIQKFQQKTEKTSYSNGHTLVEVSISSEFQFHYEHNCITINIIKLRIKHGKVL